LSYALRYHKKYDDDVFRVRIMRNNAIFTPWCALTAAGRSLNAAF